MRAKWTRRIVTLVGIATTMLILTAASPIRASVHSYPPRVAAPEIDPSALGSALALVAGGVAILSERRRRK